MCMDFELNRSQMNGYEQLPNTTLCAEETMESIVPDAFPDILRIVETDGMVFLSRKEAVSGRVEIAGNIRVFVIYEPDGEKGLRHLELTIPFSCNAEHREFSAECTVIAQARLCRADTRVINPRKILVRAETAVDVSVYAHEQKDFCVGIRTLNENEPAEQLIETKELYLISCIDEKTFSLSDDVALPVGKPAAEEILKSWVSVSQSDSKIIGNKLIFKGNINVELLYRGENGNIYHSNGELPFSQIAEVSGVAENTENRLILALTGADCRLSQSGEGRAVKVDVNVLVQFVIGEKHSIGILTDAYSIHQPLTVQWENSQLSTQIDRGSRNQNIREVWELTETVREVMDCRATVIQITQYRDGEQLRLSARTELQLLYLNEQGELFSAHKAIDVSCSLDTSENFVCICYGETVGDCYAALISGGVEVRFAVEFRYQIMAKKSISAVSALNFSEESEQQTAPRPSLVMRMLEPSERLWDVAKSYRTTTADIMTANELETESDCIGKLLLIPKRR